MITFAGLTCKNCSRPIPLPAPKHPGTFPNQQLWPMDAQTRNFLCLACGQVSAYSCVDPHWESAQDTGQDQDSISRIVVCTEVSCGKKGCDSPIKIHIVMASDATPLAESCRLLSRAKTDQIGCGKAHRIVGEMRDVKVLNAYFDFENW
jgi:hypothetical protein